MLERALLQVDVAKVVLTECDDVAVFEGDLLFLTLIYKHTVLAAVVFDGQDFVIQQENGVQSANDIVLDADITRI